MAIPLAHEHTFEWIYRSHFADWLRKNSGIFWISGKAGSGKSTLKKFLVDSRSTEDLVDGSAGPKRAVIASHFFWSAGMVMQKSHQALLQTLIFGVLKECPSLIPRVCPERWAVPPGTRTDGRWTIPELSRTLKLISEVNTSPAKFCLFVDGLDEFSGDHYELCQMLRALSQSPHLKLCVSSRSLNVFEDFFGKDPDNMLPIHHRTKDDIRSFTRSRLEDHPRWHDWPYEGETKETLIDDIAQRAEGVFLWAFLVTKALRDGLTNDDSLAGL